MILAALVIQVQVIIAEGRDGYDRRHGVRVVAATLDKISRKTGIALPIVSVRAVPGPTFPLSLDGMLERNNTYFPMAQAGGITVVLSPPLGNAAWAGVASVVCGNGVAIINAPRDVGFPFIRKTTDKIVVHEILHLLGAKHGSGGVMDLQGLRITDMSLNQVKECRG